MIAAAAQHRLSVRVVVALRCDVPRLVVLVSDLVVHVLRVVRHRFAVRPEVHGGQQILPAVVGPAGGGIKPFVQHRLAPHAQVFGDGRITVRIIGVKHGGIAVRQQDRHPVRAVIVAAQHASGLVIVRMHPVSAAAVNRQLADRAEIHLVCHTALLVPCPADHRIALRVQDRITVCAQIALLDHVSALVIAAPDNRVAVAAQAQAALAVQIAFLGDAAVLVIGPLQRLVPAFGHKGTAVCGQIAQIGRVTVLVIPAYDPRVAAAAVRQFAGRVEELLLRRVAVLIEQIPVCPRAGNGHLLTVRAHIGHIIAQPVRRVGLDTVREFLPGCPDQTALCVVAASGRQHAFRVVVAVLRRVTVRAVHRAAVRVREHSGEQAPRAGIHTGRRVPACSAAYGLTHEPEAGRDLLAVLPRASDLADTVGAGDLAVILVQVCLRQAVPGVVQGVGDLGISLGCGGDPVVLVVVDLLDDALFAVPLVNDLGPAVLAADKFLLCVVIRDSPAIGIIDVIDHAGIAEGGHHHQVVALVVIVFHCEDILAVVRALDGGIALVVFCPVSIRVEIILRRQPAVHVLGVSVAVIAARHEEGRFLRGIVHFADVIVL